MVQGSGFKFHYLRMRGLGPHSCHVRALARAGQGRGHCRFREKLWLARAMAPKATIGRGLARRIDVAAEHWAPRKCMRACRWYLKGASFFKTNCSAFKTNPAIGVFYMYAILSR